MIPTHSDWPELDHALSGFGFVPSRTGSVISTVYGDAILPRGGALALSDLLALTRRLGASDGVVRTAISRLSRNGTLCSRRRGRHAAYALTPGAEAEFRAATPTVYGPLAPPWPGATLHLAFPEPGTDRATLPGFAPLAPGVLLGLHPAPPGTLSTPSQPDPATARALAARAWPTPGLHDAFHQFLVLAAPLADRLPPNPLAAMAARTTIIHAYRRLALRTPRLPNVLRPLGWPGTPARALCLRLYEALAPASEAWLDATGDGSAPMQGGPDPVARFRPAPTADPAD